MTKFNFALAISNILLQAGGQGSPLPTIFLILIFIIGILLGSFILHKKGFTFQQYSGVLLFLFSAIIFVFLLANRTDLINNTTVDSGLANTLVGCSAMGALLGVYLMVRAKN